MKLTNENLLSVLKINRTRDELTKIFNVTDRWLRTRVDDLSALGYAIKGHSHEAGYRLLDPKFAADRLQIDKTARDLNAKSKSIKKRADAIVSRYQLEIEFDYPKLSDNLEPVIGQKYLTDEGVIVECVESDTNKPCDNCIYYPTGFEEHCTSPSGLHCSCVSGCMNVKFIKV